MKKTYLVTTYLIIFLSFEGILTMSQNHDFLGDANAQQIKSLLIRLINGNTQTGNVEVGIKNTRDQTISTNLIYVNRDTVEILFTVPDVTPIYEGYKVYARVQASGQYFCQLVPIVNEFGLNSVTFDLSNPTSCP